MRAFSQADIYFEPGPGGDYPIVALRSLPCAYFTKGSCTPCAYSARPRPFFDRDHDPYPALLHQVDNLLAHFDELFAHKTNGQLPGYRFRYRHHDRVYMLQLAGESSFFSDREIPPEYRSEILTRFLRFGNHHGLDWHLMLETRPEDLIKAAQSGELERLRPLLESLNVVVNMGFEHYDDFLRQVVFAKDLDISTFLEALVIAQQYGLDPGVFLFADAFILTPQESLREVALGLKFLEAKGAFVNLMLPNLQAFTLPDLLYNANVYTLPEPPWILDLADLLLDYTPNRPEAITPNNWFVGGLVAEPMPVGSIINHPRRQCPLPIATKFVHIIQELMTTNDRDRFIEERNKIENDLHLLKNRGHELIEDDKMTGHYCLGELTCSNSWPQRTHQVLLIAEQHLEHYLLSHRSD